jgi:hypothetical protein
MWTYGFDLQSSRLFREVELAIEKVYPCSVFTAVQPSKQAHSSREFLAASRQERRAISLGDSVAMLLTSIGKRRAMNNMAVKRRHELGSSECMVM